MSVATPIEPQAETGSRLQQLLRAGRFVVTAEVEAADSADPAAVYHNAASLAGVVDAYNATDGAGANSHMSSLAACVILARAGLEPVLQMNCRDRNRITMQGELLGAAALGIRNVLCMSGDDVSVGDQPEARRVYDLDSLHLVRTARLLRDRGVFLSGRPIAVPPRYFVGAVANPFAQPFEWRPLRLAKKVEAGAEFIQTQYCFDVPHLRQYMSRVRDLGLHERAFIIVGVGPLRSERVAEYMRTKVPGIRIPDAVVERMAQAPRKGKRREGVRICVEIIEQVRQIEGVRGVHIMAYGMEETVAEIVERAGLAGRHMGQDAPGTRIQGQGDTDRQQVP
jgi:methylenetetrahydrofolate reductase (NADPH)